MAKHKEIRQRKTRKLQQVFKVVRQSDNRIKLNDLYKQFGSEWNTSAYFIQDALKNVPEDITITALKKGGTFAVRTGNPCITIKQVTMGGLFPKQYEGRFTTIKQSDGWKAIKKLPKMFADLADETIDLFRLDISGKPSQYLQVTEQGNYIFSMI